MPINTILKRYDGNNWAPIYMKTSANMVELSNGNNVEECLAPLGGATTAQGVIAALGTLLAVAAAATYNPNSRYAVGDYCTHGGKLHKCNTDIPDGEPWNAAHWTETTVAKELAGKSNGFIGNVQEIGYTKIADITENGTYLIYDGPSFLSDYPKQLSKDRLNYGILRVTNGVSYITYDIISATHDVSDLGFAFGFKLDDGIVWERVADATPPQEYDLPLADGWTTAYCCKYFKTQDNLCIVDCGINGNVVIGSVCVATLPVGFRPKEICVFPGHLYRNGERRAADVLVLPNGEIHVYADTDGIYVSFLCVFIASG